MRKDYRNSIAITNCLNDDFPLFIFGRLIREGTIGDCPQCNSTTTYGFFGQIARLFGAKKYCINDGCIYHYFDIRKNDEKIKDKKQLLSFIKNREREIKLKRIIN